MIQLAEQGLTERNRTKTWNGKYTGEQFDQSAIYSSNKAFCQYSVKKCVNSIFLDYL